MQVKTTYIFVLLWLFALSCFSQDLAYNGNPDTSFFTARDLAFGGNRTVARDTLHHILTKYPDYSDVRSLLAKTYSWDGNYDEARKHFNRIISIERKNKEAWVAAVKNEIYAQDYYIALGLANKALIYLKNDPELLHLRDFAKEHVNTPKKRGQKSKKTLKVIDTVQSKDSLALKLPKNQISIANSFDSFDKVYDAMIYTSISYNRKTDAGPVIATINYNNRFQTHGLQYELDFYPKFSKTFYGYLNYGFSNAPIFPDQRGAVELYANLPNAIEVSAGMRMLDFGTIKATIYTGSLGLYSGNYYFSLRPYITPNPNGNTGVSGNLLVRKYLKDAENYLGINASMGFAPELKQLRDGGQLLAETLLYIESQQMQLEYQFTGQLDTNSYRAHLGLTRQELVFDSGNFVWMVSAGIRCQVKF